MSKATFIYLTYEYLFHQTVYLLYMCYLVKINNKHVLCLEDSENRLYSFDVLPFITTRLASPIFPVSPKEYYLLVRQNSL